MHLVINPINIHYILLHGYLLEIDFYRPQTKFAKVMFSQVSVCPRGVEGLLPHCMLGYTPPGPEADQRPRGPCSLYNEVQVEQV